MPVLSIPLARRTALGAIGLLALLAPTACSSDDGDDASTAGSAPSATADQTTPTTGGPEEPVTTTTTTSSPPTTGNPGEVALPLEPPPTSPNATDPAGDGCSPTSTEVLPDGTWYGQLRSADAGTATFGLDLACFFTGQAADAAALADDPGAEVPVPNGYHVRNQSDTVYPLLDEGTATVYLLDPTGGAALLPPRTGIDAAAPAIDAWEGPVNVWVVVQAGQVTLVQQQFLP
jgi:hypothetical protein